METPNPFKELISDAICPPHLKNELVSEIDLIRNAITIIDIYIGDLFGLASVLASPPPITSDDTSSSL
ncbi:hypothetical protein CWM47_23900 [Spirosoma pollinicola]|uniref:Uncharacterized protein n=1 Tax=Spirosoma pollinicola TaxID=2057025 RepID=A0A2K8Z430_9BACT|nr:hypothetical protein CWM47_23900 [Spirosoma pollinicola]